jgi:hypothetical protein
MINILIMGGALDLSAGYFDCSLYLGILLFVNCHSLRREKLNLYFT